jgi:NAD-dependent dihydropyrimidine dehydrogenase PreA subunit
MKQTRKIIEINEGLCNGCGQCVSACAEGAIQLVDGKARLIEETYCDGLAACIGECPEGALTIIEREADAFDPEAVENHLKEEGLIIEREADAFDPEAVENHLKEEGLIVEPSRARAGLEIPCGCPSARIETFVPPDQGADRPATAQRSNDSALTHWPVQIKLVPPSAPFLKGAHLLVASDCTPVAYPDFHRDFVTGKTVLLGCPKFDDVEEYVGKFADIFRTADIRNVTALIMEVPCCSKMPAIVRQGMAVAGKQVPMEVVVVSVRGKVISRQELAA